ncbi:four helix bundle protein [Flavobacterium sp.]|uniref:four helix bundle protein n=1 Tax=Flavobacterium sp. TaxID=239 RepID=UPI00262DD028|nr:four helix bundle protein [Flavobacterium sp.]
MHRFKKLEIWQMSRIFCTEIYTVTSAFPDSEKFGLASQLRRASVSIPSNIAEGSSRNSNRDFGRFVEIAIGSAYEIETQLLISTDLYFLTEEKQINLNQKLDSIIKMMYHFKNSLNQIT